MSIAAGTRLGAYEVAAQIGAGGMGEVYQAHDTKLGRDVAIKVLPEAFAYDADRLLRFQSEAKMLASLNHPNIATIHGLEQSGGKCLSLSSSPSLFERDVIHKIQVSLQDRPGFSADQIKRIDF